MSEIIKFPGPTTCEDCGKPLMSGEGTPCSHEGCERRGCAFCTKQDPYCLDHIVPKEEDES